jgi:hypothetical protein
LISQRTQKNSHFAKDLVLEHKNKRNAKSSAKSNAQVMSLNQSMADNSKPHSDDDWSSSRSASHHSIASDAARGIGNGNSFPKDLSDIKDVP